MEFSKVRLPLEVIDSRQDGGIPAAEPTFARPAWSVGGKLRFHMMIKPTGAACNLDCSYCFYLHKEQLLGQSRQDRMSDTVLERHIRQYIEAQEGDEVVFSWQGGEPTLMGLSFFRKVVELQAQYRKPDQRIENDLQTNGVLLDDEWARFLKQHNFLVGLSIDGPRELHDLYRVNRGGGPTFDSVFAASQLLKRHGVPFNALCVVNRKNAKQPRDVYRFLTRELGTCRVQFIPCVEPENFASVAPLKGDSAHAPLVGSPAARPGTEESIVTDWSVDPDDWGYFLTRAWDEWLKRDFGRIHVSLFETAVAQSMGLPAQTCTQSEICGKGLALEYNGDVYSCDHFVYPEYRLGNIAHTHEGNLVLSERQAAFGLDKRDTLPGHCRRCEHLNLCWGECPRNRFVRTPGGEAGLNYLCTGWKRFYSHIQKDMTWILQRIRGF